VALRAAFEAGMSGKQVALLVPTTSVLAMNYGWQGVFYAAASLNIVAAILAIAVLKPLRRRYVTYNR